jgi:hypothetical protein
VHSGSAWQGRMETDTKKESELTSVFVLPLSGVEPSGVPPSAYIPGRGGVALAVASGVAGGKPGVSHSPRVVCV